MKTIKKVAVSPIPEINGSVVDSFNVEDKTTNAPSVNAVENYIAEANNNVLAQTLHGISGGKVGNANDMTTMGIYRISDSTSNTNFPTEKGNGVLIVFNNGEGPVVQMFINFMGGTHIRMCWYGTWQSWIQMTNA